MIPILLQGLVTLHELYKQNQMKRGWHEGARKQKNIEHKDRDIDPGQQIPKPVLKLKSSSEMRVEEGNKEDQKQ